MDDVVNPPLEQIDGAMYRVNLCDYPGSKHDGVYIEDDEYGEEYATEVLDGSEDMPVIEENGDARTYYKLMIRFRVPKALHGHLIGKGGTTRMRIEQETRTKMVLPRKDEDGDIVITSKKEQHLRSAYQTIRSLIKSSRNTISPTHFVSLPLNAPNIRERFEMFKKQVLEQSGKTQETLNQNLFNLPEKLHLTLTVLTLLDDDERRISCERLDQCLESVIQPVLKNQPVAVRVKGIDIMNDDPTAARILFAKTESANNILQQLADEIHNFFSKDGFVKDKFERDHVKLHVTLMNVSFLESEDEELNTFRTQKKRPTFDATKILEDFRDFDFGSTVVNSLHLSQMHAYSEDGYYLSSNRIKWA